MGARQFSQDMDDAKIVTLYKNKGDCNIYKWISLVNAVGKLFAFATLGRLQRLAGHVYPESQCGFKAERSTISMISSCHQKQMLIYITFIDLTMVFNLVSRDGLFQILLRIRCPPKLHQIIRSFHEDMKATIQYDGNTSESFSICSRVNQGCILAPTLFRIFSILLRHAFGVSNEGIYFHSRTDGQLFNLACLRVRTKIWKTLIRDILFADDATITTHTEQQFQHLMDCFFQVCKDSGLTISLKKLMYLDRMWKAQASITIVNYKLEAVHLFTYLGSWISDILSLDVESTKTSERLHPVFQG